MSLLLLPHLRGLYAPNVAALGGYATASSDYNGTDAYLTRGADLDGLADGRQGTISAWVRLDGGDGANIDILNSGPAGSSRFTVRRANADTFAIFAALSAGTQVLNISSTNTYIAGPTWRHLLASWDLTTGGARHLYVDGVSDLTVTVFLNLGNIDYTQGNFAVGALNSGGNKFNGCLSEVFFHTTYLDITVEANRRKFISAHGRPVSLGADGSLPLGVQPLIYLRDGGIAANLGSGGAFTENGTLTVGSTAP